MKNIILAIVVLFMSVSLLGQEQTGGEQTGVEQKGSFLTIAGGFGGGGFQYVPKGLVSDGTNKDKFGWNAKFAYSYFFTYHWGVSVGLGMSYYRTIGTFKEDFAKDKFYNLGWQMDDDDKQGRIRDYELRVRLANWEEEQKGYFFEIPLMLFYKHKFGDAKRHGIYFGLGAKLQIPIIKTVYRVLDGKYEDDRRLNVSGYYPETAINSKVEFGSFENPSVEVHGFGTINNPWEALKWEGDLNLKMSVAGTVELGFLFGISPRVDLMVGGYFDYGFNNIKKGDDVAFLEAPPQYLSTANNNVGGGIKYGGMINTNKTEKTNLMAYGGRLGLHIKVGKLEEAEKKEPTPLPQMVFEDNSDLDSLERQLAEMRKMLQDLLTAQPEPEPQQVQQPVKQEVESMIIVQGTVIDARTRAPLSAIVELSVARTNKLAAIVRTDSITGAYKFSLDEPGTYILDVRKEGYLFYSEQFMIPFSRDRQVVDQLVLLSKLEVNQNILLKNIFFDTGKSTLKPESMSEIERVYKLMVDNPTMEIEISGHTDNVGSDVTNKKLSAARAAVVVQALVSKGISASRMTSAGYGFDRPIAPNTTPDGRAQNRRTEFKITKM